MKKIIPLEYRVLVELDPVEERSAGGIVIHTQDSKSREQMAQSYATVLDTGGNAFEDWKDERTPKAGDRVLITSYEGKRVDKDTEDRRRICNDKDIVAIIEE